MTLVQPPRHAAVEDDEFEDSGITENGITENAEAEVVDEPIDTAETLSRRGVGRWILAGVAFLATLLIGVLAGGVAFMNTSPTLRPPAVDLSPDQVASAKDSVSSAKMMIDLMSTAVDSSTAGIDKVISSIEPTFKAIDTAAAAADQMATGLAAAPTLQTAATQIQQLGTSVTKGLDEAGKLAQSAKDIDELITPVIDSLSRNKVPGADKTIAQLKSMQTASRDIAAQLGDLGPLRNELKAATDATGPAAKEIDGAVAGARTAANQLKEGLANLSSAKADTEKAADAMTGGIKQLKIALGTVSNNLSSADDSLMSDDAAPAYVYDHANRIGSGIVTGAATALGLLVLAAAAWGVVRWRRRVAA
ncbi:hypothetical protein [Gordonia phthalatica]|uniref:hypothetical protein n=1 Tax=Gordonia phthalatica TaxID=1136941 RepID=UPI000A8DF98E|nr:hypothetical protein [Gordonia phthalatica]